MKYHTAVPIGRGGMGEVVRAWDPTLNRNVALKFLRSDDPELEERMLREARAQARVSHPNICPVYEVGRHEGRVYIAMQLIEGRPLDEAVRDLGVEQRVSLVRTVAEAVHAAHAAGLVHRDLKPANILVERTEDGELNPWIVDFGIAREREVEGATVTGQVLGTPGYLSPEQARGEVSTIDRRSDVFSLGVVLYELLAGSRPHAGDSDVEVLVSLLESEPVPLRKTAPHVPRDLETIVMTCLESDRERRYGSARALADDLGRYLAGEPIEARPVGVVRRIVVRVRRNPVAAGLLGVAALAIIVLALGLVASSVKYTTDLKRERDLARQAQHEAEAREREAVEVTESLAGLFELADPRQRVGKSLTAEELLTSGEKRLEQELADQPLRLARLLDVMASSHRELGNRGESERLARRALALRRDAAGEGSLPVAESLWTLATALEGENNTEAETTFREALRIHRAHLGDGGPAVARLQVDLADLLLQQRRASLDEAEGLVAEALPVLRHALGEDDSATLQALQVSASLMLRRDNLEGACTALGDLVERWRRVRGQDEPQLATVLNNLAYARRRLGDFAGAETAYREALSLVVRVWGEQHPSRIQVMQNLAAVLRLQHRDDDTEAMLREIIALRRSQPDADHWRLGSDLVSGLGRFLIEQERWRDAEATVREGVGVYAAALGDGHPWTDSARMTLAGCLIRLGATGEAERLASMSLARLEHLDQMTPPVRRMLVVNAEELEAAGRPDLGRRCRAILERTEQQPSSSASLSAG